MMGDFIVIAVLVIWAGATVLLLVLRAGPTAAFLVGAVLGILTTRLGFWLGTRRAVRELEAELRKQQRRN